MSGPALTPAEQEELRMAEISRKLLERLLGVHWYRKFPALEAVNIRARALELAVALRRKIEEDRARYGGAGRDALALLETLP